MSLEKLLEQLADAIATKVNASQEATQLAPTEAATSPKEERLLTKKEVAEMLACSLSSVERMMRNGTLQAYRIGGNQIRFKLSEVEAMIEDNKLNFNHPSC